MADFAYVPKALSEDDVYIRGLTIMSKSGIGNYKLGYVANMSYSIKVGLYQSSSNLHIVVASAEPVSDIHIYLVSPASTTLFDITGIANRYEDGYYADDSYTIVPDTTACTIYTSRADVLSRIKFATKPSEGSGVVVTINGSPIDVPPYSSGVIVNIIGRLLDPNAQEGTSEIGGGQGTFDDTSDVVPVPALPSLSASDSGMLTIYKPTLSELHDLGAYLWTNLTDFIENLQKMFSNPMDYFIAFHIVPCNPSVMQARTVKLGLWNTSVIMSPVASQWYEFNCGTVTLSEFWGSALDYAPNTKVSLFLPFIGSVELNTDDVMGRQIGLIYRIDLLSGQCVAMVTVNVKDGQAPTVLYQYTGDCAVSVPLTGADWSRIYSAALSATGTAITGAIAAGAAGAAAGSATSALAGAKVADAAANIGQAYSAINASSKGVKGVVDMRNTMQQAANMALAAGREAAAAPARVAHGIRASRIANTINNTVGSVMAGKYKVSHSGSISGSAGMLGNKRPYLLVDFPNQSLAENYKHFVGYPSNLAGKLGTFRGYTECEQVILNNFWGIDSEQAELLEALKGGVYL